MPVEKLITGVEGIQILNIEGDKEITVHADFVGQKVCNHCHSSKVRLKDGYFRTLKHTRTGNRIITLRLKVFKVKCLHCGKYSASKVPGILPRRRATESFRREVFEKHHGGLSQTFLAKTHDIGAATIERWYHDFIVYRVKELSARSCPKILGIDEHFFTRKLGYATTLTDIRNGKVFDVTLGRSDAALSRYLSGLKGRHQVKIVVMDLSETYRSIVKKFFPQAKIISDRFHVVRLVNYYFQKVWQSLDPHAKNNRGLLSLMRRNPWHLSDSQTQRLHDYLASVPGLLAIYEAREKLLKLILMKNLKFADARAHLGEFLNMITSLLHCPMESLRSLGKTLQSWSEEIVRMWRTTLSNAITEGFHNKMEMISRRAFGFKNFNNYRLRVIALCGWDGISLR